MACRSDSEMRSVDEYKRASAVDAKLEELDTLRRRSEVEYGARPGTLLRGNSKQFNGLI